MARRFIVILITLFARLSHASDADFLRNENIELSIGDAHEISIPEGASINISRRGIIDAQVLPSKLRIVGIKNGLVVLTLSQGSKEEDLKYFVTVKPREDEPPKTIDDLKNLCEGAGLNFLEKTQEVKGTANDHLLFYRIKQLCEAKKTCTFAASLSENAKTRLQTALSNSYGSTFEVLVKNSGAIAVLVPCNDKISEKESGKVIQHLSGNDLLQKNLVVACKKDWYSGYFTLYAKMIVMESSTAKDIGLQSKLETVGTFADPLLKTNLDLGIHAALKNKKAKLIGEPVLWLLSGVDARAQSGSEILVLKSNAESNSKHAKYVWKDIGLDLKVKIFPLEANRVRLQYSFLMSNATKDAGQIHKNKLESEVELSVEKSAIVGGIQFKTNGDSKDTVPFLDSIPIFGPLFKMASENETESNIFLYFYLTHA